MKRRTLLVVNARKPEAAEAVLRVRELVRQHGILVGEVSAEAEPSTLPPPDADLVVVFGGDGTLIAQARRWAGPGRALLGVNFGRLGFLAEFDLASLELQAARLFGGGEMETREFPLIRVGVRGEHDVAERFVGVALNEAVITAGPPFRMVLLSMRVNGGSATTIGGDGLIVCSGVGSTAYNLAAGGPILAPGVDAFVITALAPHSLAVRPVVVPGDSRIDVQALRVNRLSETVGVAAAGSADELGGVALAGTTLMLDGQVHVPIMAGDHVSVSKHERSVRFVQNTSTDYWSRLVGKLNWSAPPVYGSGT